MMTRDDMNVELDKAIERYIRRYLKNGPEWDCETDEIVRWFHPDYDGDGMPAIQSNWGGPAGKVSLWAFGRASGWMSLTEAKRWLKWEFVI